MSQQPFRELSQYLRDLFHDLRLVISGSLKPTSLSYLHPSRGSRTCSECGCLHDRAASYVCTRCSGWSCGHCGRPKLPEQDTCGRTVCKRAHTRERNRQREEEAEKVVPMRGDRSA